SDPPARRRRRTLASRFARYRDFDGSDVRVAVGSFGIDFGGDESAAVWERLACRLSATAALQCPPTRLSHSLGNVTFNRGTPMSASPTYRRRALVVSVITAMILSTPAFADDPPKKSDAPAQLTSQQDHKRMLELLKIKELRRGAE